MKQSDLIINNRKALKTHHKVTSAGITLLFWFIIFYLWQPLISLVAWAFGYKVFYEHMIILGGFEGFIEILIKYVIIILLLGGSLIIWALINKTRFRNKIRRASSTSAGSEDIADFFKVDSQQQKEWSTAQNLTLSITDNFEISGQVNK